MSSIEGGWRLKAFEDGEGEQRGAAAPDFDDADWLPATVPGQVHMDLMDGGIIPDPFFGLNYGQCLWVEEKEWWYRVRFAAPAQDAGTVRTELVCEGLDTFATVYLNGERLEPSFGRHPGTEAAALRNMWVPAAFNVTGKLRPGGNANVLAVRLRPWKAAVREAMAADPTPDADSFFSPRERIYARKAQMSFGWDIAPRIVTVGIWRPVRLEVLPAHAIRDVWVRAGEVSPERAVVSAEVRVESFSEAAVGRPEDRRTASDEMLRSAQHDTAITCRLRAKCGDSVVEAAGAVAEGLAQLEVTVLKPRLWWPHGMGAPDLYEGEVTLEQGGRVVHRRAVTFGIRDMRLHLADPETGANRFFFTINGERRFILGTNWIPVDAMFARVTRERLAAVLQLLLDAHNHMVRIWGGGIYESPDFYDLCDRLGIMVWQDFTYACGRYPQSDDFLAQVRAEGEGVVRALRNHPSLVLWAGDNENDCAYGWGEGGGAEAYLRNRLTREVLPEVCARLDPDRPYIPSSPFNPSGHGDPNAPDEGDVHLWDHSKRPRDPLYFADRSLFLSEIGRICAANRSSTERFLAPADRWPVANKAWEHHVGTIPTCDFERRAKTDLGIRNLIGRDAESLSEYIAASQYGQAWCLSEWIERARRRKFECGGILWWNLFDNWPEHVDAVVDYYFGRKAAYAAVQRACRPVCPSVCHVTAAEGKPARFEVWLLNETRQQVGGRLTVERRDVGGNVVVVRVAQVVGAVNASTPVLEIPDDEVGPLDPDQEYLAVRLETAAGEVLEAKHVLDACQSLGVLASVFGPVDA